MATGSFDEATYFGARWINPKLLYAEVSFDPHSGAYWVYDVEAQKVVVTRRTRTVHAADPERRRIAGEGVLQMIRGSRLLGSG